MRIRDVICSTDRPDLWGKALLMTDRVKFFQSAWEDETAHMIETKFNTMVTTISL